MFNYTLRRLAATTPVLLIASFVAFWAIRSTFDPTAKLRTSRDSARAVAEARKRLGLDDSIFVQWGRWLGRVLHGDLGTSSRSGDKVSTMIAHAFPNTLRLVVWGIAVSAVVAIGIGVYSAVRQYSVADYFFTGLSYVGVAMPPFWFALVAIQLFAIDAKQLFGLDRSPFSFIGLGDGFFGSPRYLVLPVMTLTVQIIASWSRFQRAAMLDVLGSDYVRTARAKGLPKRTVIFKHAFRNALIPLVTVMAIDAGALFGGLIITESIFSIPGMGRLFLDGLVNGDVDVVVGWMLVAAVFIVLFNLLADIAYGLLDPRIRLT